MEPEKTTPGITVAGASCEGLQAGLPRQGGFSGAVYQTFSPVGILKAKRPPPSGISVFDVLKLKSESGTNITSSKAAEPHMMPPCAPPFPMRVCQRIAPS